MEALAASAAGQTLDDVKQVKLGAGELSAVLARAASDDIDVPALALAAGMPVRTFRRRFAAAMGVSPHAWLMQRRLDAARDAVVRSDTPLAQLAAEFGFASQTHMAQLFVQRSGSTPARLRKAGPQA